MLNPLPEHAKHMGTGPESWAMDSVYWMPVLSKIHIIKWYRHIMYITL